MPLYMSPGEICIGGKGHKTLLCVGYRELTTVYSILYTECHYVGPWKQERQKMKSEMPSWNVSYSNHEDKAQPAGLTGCFSYEEM